MTRAEDVESLCAVRKSIISHQGRIFYRRIGLKRRLGENRRHLLEGEFSSIYIANSILASVAIPRFVANLDFPHDLPNVLVISQPHKLSMPQVTIRRPFGELDLAANFGLGPHTFFISCLASLSKKQVVAVS